MDDMRPVGGGSPGSLHLHEVGRVVHNVFGAFPWLVGSCLKGKNPRDIDVRIGVNDLRFMALFPDFTSWYRPGTQSAVVCMAFSALAKQMTVFSIDFQVQHTEPANHCIDEPKFVIDKDLTVHQT